jgi:hypothetical protein
MLNLKEIFVNPLVVGHLYEMEGVKQNFYLRISIANESRSGRELFIADVSGISNYPEPINVLPDIQFAIRVDNKTHYFMINKGVSRNWQLIGYDAII